MSQEPPSFVRRIGSAPSVWLWAVTVLLAAVSVGPLLPAPLTYAIPDLGYYVSYPGLSAVQAILFFWASRRRALGPRLRQALQLSAAAFTLSAVTGLPDLLAYLKAPVLIASPIHPAFTFTTYVLGLAGILRMPMQRMARSDLLVFLCDVAISVLGLGSLMTVLVTMPQLREARGDVHTAVLVYGAAQALLLVGLNVLILRGVARPSARAFWFFVGSLLCNILAAAMWQLQNRQEIVDLAMFAKGTLLCWAAVAFARDPIAPGEPHPTPQWMTSFNPLPIGATIGLLALLVHAALIGDVEVLWILALAVVAQVALLIGRLFLTARENARLLADQAERERQMTEAKMQAVGRLAGGIAHWFNNLLTTVIGHAELGVAAAQRDGTVVDDFASIRDAADRAARLTRQLLAFSGREPVWATDVDLAGVVISAARSLRASLPAGTDLVALSEAPIGDGGTRVRADRRLIEAVVHELVRNAADAMPSGGTITVRIGSARIDRPAPDAALPVTTGSYVVVDVEDTGVGITPDVRRSMFDPFFTTKPIHAAAGLGLASVYGIVAAHNGGIDVESAPGRGTRVRILLPFAAATTVGQPVHTPSAAISI